MWYYWPTITRVRCFIVVSNEEFSHKQTAWSDNGSFNGTDRKCDPSKLMAIPFLIQNTTYLIESNILSYTIDDCPYNVIVTKEMIMVPFKFSFYWKATQGILNSLFVIIMLLFLSVVLIIAQTGFYFILLLELAYFLLTQKAHFLYGKEKEQMIILIKKVLSVLNGN